MEVGKKQYKAWLYLAPTLILLIIFTIYPLINTFIIAFKENYNYLNIGYGKGPDSTEYEFSSWGLANFKAIFTKGDFLQYLKTTMIIVFVSVPISVVLSLIIAIALNSIKALQKFYQTVFFMPYVTNTIAIGMGFSVMFATHGGLINNLIKVFGGQPQNWLGGDLMDSAGNSLYPSYWKSMLVLLTYITWNALPFKILILLSGLQSIDKQYYQAAQIDGANKMRIALRITVPLLSPQIAYLTITSFIGAFKEYSSVVAIFGNQAGPKGYRRQMATVVWYVYDRMKTSDMTKGMGYAAAAAVVLFVIIMFFTAINSWVSNKRVHY